MSKSAVRRRAAAEKRDEVAPLQMVELHRMPTAMDNIGSACSRGQL
jgi:hypothetical protein